MFRVVVVVVFKKMPSFQYGCTISLSHHQHMSDSVFLSLPVFSTVMFLFLFLFFFILPITIMCVVIAHCDFSFHFSNDELY